MAVDQAAEAPVFSLFPLLTFLSFTHSLLFLFFCLSHKHTPSIYLSLSLTHSLHLSPTGGRCGGGAGHRGAAGLSVPLYLSPSLPLSLSLSLPPSLSPSLARALSLSLARSSLSLSRSLALSLTHALCPGNLLALDPVLEIGEKDVGVSLLPWAQPAGFVGELLLTARAGASVACSEGRSRIRANLEEVPALNPDPYRGTSLIRNRPPLGPYSGIYA